MQLYDEFKLIKPKVVTCEEKERGTLESGTNHGLY